MLSVCLRWTSSKLDHKTKPQDLDILGVCKECGYSAIFRNDFEDHKREKGHHNVVEFDLSTGNILTRYRQTNN